MDSYIHFMLLLKLLNLVMLKMKGNNEYLYHIYIAVCMLFPLINPISIYLSLIYLSILLLIFLYILYFSSIIDFYNSIWLTYWLIFGLFKVNIYSVIIIIIIVILVGVVNMLLIYQQIIILNC